MAFNTRLLLFCGLCFLGHEHAGTSSSPRPTTETSVPLANKLDSLFRTLALHRGFNGNVLVAQHGDIVYKNAFGYANLKAKTPLNIQSSFQLASVSKQFTAMAIMMLHDEGKLEFSDTLQKFFPAFPYKNITLHQLLSHRSGLPDYMGFASHYWTNRRKFMNNWDVMNILLKNHPGVVFKPDRKYKYSNTGYAILACVVEHVTNEPFHLFLETRIFNPLGMDHTFLMTTQEPGSVAYSTIGHKKNRRPAEEDFLSGVIGDKGIYSTVEDMFKWDQALYTERLVKQSTLQEAFVPVSYDRKNHSDYGYGWRIEQRENGTKIVYHAGWWRGYNSLFARRLSDTTAIIILSNKVNWSFRGINRLMDIIDSAQLEPTTSGGN
jgi:CubicO group peptidase (beta-lactamase class C family)